MRDPGVRTDRIATLEDEITALRADNARLRRLLDEEGMPDSLRHGLRDTVAMMHTIMRRTADNATDVEEYHAHLGGRLDAIVRARFLTDVFGEAELRRLISDALGVYLVLEGERAVLDGPDVRLRPKAAQAFALAVYELATNAVEHGILGEVAGRVSVSWQIVISEAAPTLHLVWREIGAIEPPPVGRPGFGTTVLEEMLPHNLGAQVRLAYEPDGLHCNVCLPFTQWIGRVVDAEPARGADDECS